MRQVGVSSIVVAVLVAAGCSGDDGKPGDGSDAGSAADAAVDAEPDAVNDMDAPTLAISVDNPHSCTVAGSATSEPITRGTGHVSFTSADVGSAGNITWVCTPSGGLPAVTCGPGAASSCNCTPTHGFDFTGLVAGDYMLTITATDAASNHTTQAVTWRVDTTAPIVTFGSPPGGVPSNIVALFLQQGSFADGTGTFTVDTDVSANAPSLACSVTGTGGADPVACSATFDGITTYNGSYTIPGTVSEVGGHTSVIVATDCVGNQQTYTSASWSADKLAPAETNAPVISTTASGGGALPSGSVRIHFSLLDDVTNVQTLSCSLDGSLANACGTWEGSGLPTTAASFSDTTRLDELSAGSHHLTYTATDVWGHSATYTLDFSVSLGTSLGHVSLIGHDYESLLLPPGAYPVQTDEIRNIVGNAVHQSAARNYSRPLRVKIMAMPTTHAVEIQNVESTITARLGQFGTTSSLIEWLPASATIASANVASELRGMDVLVLLDANSPPTYGVGGTITNLGTAGSLGASATWITALHDFVANGGIVVATDGSDSIGSGAGTPSENFRMLGNPEGGGPTPLLGVDKPEVISAAAAANSIVFRECKNVHELTQGDANGGGFNRIDGYYAPHNTVRYRAYDLQAARLLANYATTGGNCTLPAGGCETKYVVLDRIYVPRTDLGPVHLNAWRDGHKAGTDATAVFHDVDGSVLVDADGNQVSCSLDADGTASYDRVPAGGMVTVADPQGNGASGARIQTAQAVAIADSITVGQTVRDRDGGSLGSTSGFFPSCSISACAAVDHYTVTNGCDITTTTGTSYSLETDRRCLYQTANVDCDPLTGCVTVMVEARDSNDTVLAYTTNLDTNAGPGIWSPSSSSFASWRAPRQRSIPAVGSFPQGVTGTIISMVSLGEVSTSAAIAPFILYNERDPNESTTLSFFATASTDPFGQVFHHWFGIDYTVASSRQEVTAVIRDLAMPANDNVTADISTVLPRIKTAQFTTGGVRPIVHYQSDGAPTSLSTAKGGWVEMSYQGCDAFATTSWQMMFPAVGDTGNVQFPALPASLGCAVPTNTPVLASVGFCDPSNLTVVDLRRAFLPICEPAYDAVFFGAYDRTYDRHPASTGAQLRVTGSYHL